MQAGATTDGAVREWRPAFPVDVAGVLAPAAPRPRRPDLRHDRRTGGGLAHRDDPGRPGDDPAGPAAATARSSCRRGGRARRGRWTGCPPCWATTTTRATFVAHHPLVADAHRRMAGLRFGATRRVWDALVPAVLEQKVTGTEARRSWRELVRRYGDPAPGPGARRPARAADARADPRGARLGVAPGGRRPRPAPGDPGLRPRSRTGWRAPCELGGAAGRELLRRVPGHRRVDRGGGRPARVGRRRRRERRRLPHPHASSAGRCSAARWTTPGCSPRCWPRTRRSGSGRCGTWSLSGFRSPASARGSPRATTARCDAARADAQPSRARTGSCPVCRPR